MLWHVYVNEIKEQEIWKGGTMIVTTIGVDFPEELIFDPRKDFDEVKIMEEAFRLTEKSLEKILQDNSTILPTITMGGLPSKITISECRERIVNYYLAFFFSYPTM